MPKIVCVKCKRELRVAKNEVYYIETFKYGPYRVWNADKFQCPECGTEILSGYGNNPILSHFDKDFADKLNTIKANWTYIEEMGMTLPLNDEETRKALGITSPLD